MSIDLTSMSVLQLNQLAADVAAELAGRQSGEIEQPATEEPVLRKIICRKKDLNAKGNGDMETRRVRLPDGSVGWASDMAQDLDGSWEQGAYLASQRRCTQKGLFPVGTIVLAFTSSMRGGSKSGSASIAAGVIVAKEDDATNPIAWGLSTKGTGMSVQVKTPAGEWVTV